MRPELLAPAGDEQTARAALLGGADAIYLGLDRFSARESAVNLDLQALSRTAELAHLLGAKVYVCLNTLVKDDETDDFFASARLAYLAGADALLIQDLFLGKTLKALYPEIVLHLSTQAGCCNRRGALLAKEYGFSRVVLARETPIEEIPSIASVLETEVFVQGALCTCFSGQCYLSSFAGNNSGNRGRCKQPCRKRYSIDREGYREFSYALSPADLCVGKRIDELIAAGVVSLKIEGRMRRQEYVLSAIAYYRALLAGEGGEQERSDLTRAYNRGDYTQGLAFGQHGFLSKKVQGHIGERVGFMRDQSFCPSAYPAKAGDGFKILRDGKEVGGARLSGLAEGGFFLSSKEPLKKGDEVRLTTDSELLHRLKGGAFREIALSLFFVAGERARIVCGDFEYMGEVLSPAKTSPLTERELELCFCKTDGYPFRVRFIGIQTQGAFMQKSALNAFRRDFFAALVKRLCPVRTLPERKAEECIFAMPARRVAVIAESFKGLEADILIYKPRDYSRMTASDTEGGRGEKYLFLPPFFTAADEEAIKEKLPLFDGIYCDGYYGLSLAREYRLKFFAGTGFNLSNRFAVARLREEGAAAFALSKELSRREQLALAAEGAFALTLGSVKVMDLAYCPFEGSCATCDKRAFYTLTDEEGRAFPLRRYRAAGKLCRFELFNCAPLAAGGGMSALVDLTGQDAALLSYAFCPSEAPLYGATRGHSERSMK